MNTAMNGQGNAPALDPALLARLTGGLGDRRSLEKICADFGQLYSEFLPDVLHSETGLPVEVMYINHDTGLLSDLLADLGDGVVIADASLRNWSPRFAMACGNGFVITLMESLLGGLPDTIDEPIQRPLSRIELDLSAMVFDKFASVLRSGVNAPGGFESTIETPRNGEDYSRVDDGRDDIYAATIRMSIKLGHVESEFMLLIPQKALLKTKVTMPKSKNQASRKGKEWSDQIAEQVRRSQVTLEARIRLEQLTLGIVSRLAVGDVIPFRDRGDISVDVSANGKEMYRCEFGRSGENYTVRVKDNYSTDDEILKHLMG